MCCCGCVVGSRRRIRCNAVAVWQEVGGGLHVLLWLCGRK